MGWTDARNATLQNKPILILSADAVAGALLGALIETFGYQVRFARAAEHTDDAIRRVRPGLCLLDCGDPAACNSEVLGRAAMRRIPVVIFGTAANLERVRRLADEHQIEMLRVPPDLSDVEATFARAVRRLE